mmetsp:Transcript_689/g.853  ORF Transcript_689/g.853 Transcript_689/m.853 type:complete len:84 (-) Transcript_689:1197-1448(-)
MIYYYLIIFVPAFHIAVLLLSFAILLHHVTSIERGHEDYNLPQLLWTNPSLTNFCSEREGYPLKHAQYLRKKTHALTYQSSTS